MKLDPPVERGHLVVDVCDRKALTEEVWREDDRTVREPDLYVFESLGVRLALLVLIAPTVVAPRRVASVA